MSVIRPLSWSICAEAWLLCCTAVLTLAFGCNKSSDAELAPPASIAAGSAPPASASPKTFEVPDGLWPIRGPELIEKVKRSSAKAILINAWASWCGSCKAEMPMLLEVQRRYAKQGVEVWFVTVDEPQDMGAALSFLKERGAPLPSYIANGRLGPFKRALAPRWQGTLPATFLYDTSGKLRYFWGAQVFEQELLPILDGFLAGKDIDGAANFKVRIGERR